MLILVLLSHPARDSLTGALADAACEALVAGGHEVRFHHLDAEGFDPRLAADELAARRSDDALIERHCAELAAADGIVVAHPNWWSQPPALLKGWLDRVVRPGVAYDFVRDEAGRSVPVGLLRARAAVVLNTASLPQVVERETLGDPLQVLWEKAVFARCGVNAVHRRVYAVTPAVDAAQRAAWCDEVRALVLEAFPPA